MCREGLYFSRVLFLIGAFLISPFALAKFSSPYALGIIFQVILGLILIFFPFLMLDFREKEECYLLAKKLQKLGFLGIIFFSLLELTEFFGLNSYYFPAIVGLGASLFSYAFGKWLGKKYIYSALFYEIKEKYKKIGIPPLERESLALRRILRKIGFKPTEGFTNAKARIPFTNIRIPTWVCFEKNGKRIFLFNPPPLPTELEKEFSKKILQELSEEGTVIIGPVEADILGLDLKEFPRVLILWNYEIPKILDERTEILT